MTSGEDRGGFAESAVRDVAAVLGLPDFVYTVPRVRKGRANREVGDALLVANGAGVPSTRSKPVALTPRTPEARG